MYTCLQVLHDLINIIVLVLLEPGVANLPEGGHLIRALNVLTVKIVERSDHTAVSIALLRLLQVPSYPMLHSGFHTGNVCSFADPAAC